MVFLWFPRKPGNQVFLGNPEITFPHGFPMVFPVVLLGNPEIRKSGNQGVQTLGNMEIRKAGNPGPGKIPGLLRFPMAFQLFRRKSGNQEIRKLGNPATEIRRSGNPGPGNPDGSGLRGKSIGNLEVIYGTLKRIYRKSIRNAQESIGSSESCRESIANLSGMSASVGHQQEISCESIRN